jgi:hypothetical protein
MLVTLQITVNILEHTENVFLWEVLIKVIVEIQHSRISRYLYILLV